MPRGVRQRQQVRIRLVPAGDKINAKAAIEKLLGQADIDDFRAADAHGRQSERNKWARFQDFSRVGMSGRSFNRARIDSLSSTLGYAEADDFGILNLALFS